MTKDDSRKSCFVVMSFEERFDPVYQMCIKPTIEAMGINCTRMDDDPGPKNIPISLVREIIGSDFVIVDVSKPSPNVYYELGISHTVGNKTIIITQDISTLPFDLRGELVIEYSATRGGYANLSSKLSLAMKSLQKKGSAPTNIVQQAGSDYFDSLGRIYSAIEKLNSERERLAEFRKFLAEGRPTIENSTSIDTVCDRIVDNYPRISPMVVSISGAAGIGKSTFSAAIASRLRERHGIDSVCVLPLDSFMLDRANRIKSGLSGYHPRANDLAAAERGIQALISGNHISVRPYSHVTGSHMEEFKISGGQRVYILDGIHSMHPQLINFVSLSIFLWAEDDELKELRFISDVLDRCYVIRDAFNHADAEFNEYQKHVAKYSKVADMNLRIFGYWKMQEN